MTDESNDDLPSNGGNDNPDDADAIDLEHLLWSYQRVRPLLRHNVFKLEAGWRYSINKAATAVFISLWEGGQVGFAFGITDNSASSAFISVYCMNSTEERALQPVLRLNERQIRKRLGRAFFWENDYPYPLGEYVLANKPVAVASRLATYRDTFTAHLDKVMPRRS